MEVSGRVVGYFADADSRGAEDQAFVVYGQFLEERLQARVAHVTVRFLEGFDAVDSDEEQSLLRKKERELERLNRESEAERSAANQLDRLDRELEQAAEDLMKDLGLSAGDLEQGAEDINHLDQQQMSQEEKEQLLRQKLQEMRQLLREQGRGARARWCACNTPGGWPAGEAARTSSGPRQRSSANFASEIASFGAIAQRGSVRGRSPTRGSSAVAPGWLRPDGPVPQAPANPT